MESIFKFKKPEKVMIGGFDPDDQQEWALLIKPQIGDATLFVHFHKLWLVTEQPKIEPDPDNNIEGQDEVVRQSTVMIYTGFIKDDKFVVEKTRPINLKVDIAAQREFLRQLEFYVKELNFEKDWNNYAGDFPAIPSYYGHQDSNKSGGFGNAKTMINQILGGHQSMGNNPHVKMQPATTVGTSPAPAPPQPNVKKKLSTLFGNIVPKNP